MTKSTSKVIMAATLVMVVSLAMVLGLVLVLLAELYCSLLLRRRGRSHGHGHSQRLSLPTTTAATAPISTSVSSVSERQGPESQPSSANHLTTFYSQGVIDAPRKLLFPSLPSSQESSPEPSEKDPESSARFSKLLQVQKPDADSSLPSQEIRFQVNNVTTISTASSRSAIGNEKKAASCIDEQDHFVYISNPIYENDTSTPRTEDNTPPFETPDSSPSRLETGGGSSEEEEREKDTGGYPMTPPLTPIKKLPAEACSVSLRDASSLVSGSETNGGSFSSSQSPCTSPSW